MRFGCGFLSAYDPPADIQKSTMEIYIAPFQADKLALSEACAYRSEEEWIERRAAGLCDLEQLADFLCHQRVNMRVDGFPRRNEPPEMGHRIDRHEPIIHCMMIGLF